MKKHTVGFLLLLMFSSALDAAEESCNFLHPTFQEQPPDVDLAFI